MKRLYLTLLVALATLVSQAAAPNGSGTYYSSANGKKGAALKTALCSVIYNRTEKSYDYLWTAFYTTDVRSDGKIWDMYSNITNYTPVTSGSSYSVEGDCYNREHSFPQSWFSSNAPMYTDLHHIYPTDAKVNGMRSNYPFGETNGNKYKSANDFSKLGSCKLSGYTGTVFEPADAYKGDFARTYFYMVTCYEEKLADWYAGNADGVRATIDGSTYPALQLWQLNMLLKWAKNDPVSQKEINRNNAVYGIQRNRNPFIDYPGLEQYIWGSCKDVDFSYNNYVEPTEYSTEYNSGSGSGSGGGGSGSGDEVVDELNVTGWGNYSTSSYSAAGTDYIGTGGTTSVSYAMQVFNGSTGAVRGNQSGASNFSCRNTTTYTDYYIKEVKLTVTGGTIDGSTSGRSVVYFGSSTYANPNTTAPSGTATAASPASSGQTTLTWTNTDTSKDYFILYNLKTSGTTASAVVTVTWALKEPPAKTDPSFNNLSDLSVNYGSTLTLTKGTTGTPNIVTDGTVTLTSSNNSVVTVSGLTITPVAVGTAIITINAAASENYNAASTMAEITVNAPEGKTTAAPAASFAKVTSADDITDGKYLIVCENNNVAFDGSLTTLDAVGNKIAVSINAGTIAATNATKASAFTINTTAGTIQSVSGYYIGQTSNANGLASNTATAYTNTLSINGGNADIVSSGGAYLRYNATENQTRFRYFKSSTYTSQQAIQLYKLSGADLTVKFNASGYATYCSEYPLDFSEATDYGAWQVTGISGTTITFEKITGSVKGGTGLFLMGTPEATVTLTSANSTNTLDDNLLVGTLAPTYVAKGTAYGLSGEQFVKNSTGGTINAGKAYIDANDVPSSVKNFTFQFVDDENGITEPRTATREEVEAIFNLSGQRLQKPVRGINIINGKKVFVK